MLSDGRPARRITGAYREILLACTIITLPMISLSGILLGLILCNQVSPNRSISKDLHIPQAVDNDNAAYLVNFSATRLITIASWTSSVAPLLPTFIMTLLSYPAARRIMLSSQINRTSSLPTPYQLSLMLGLLSGNFGSLWNWLKYMFWRQREKQASVVSTLMFGLTAATSLGCLILAADTWLHVTTSTVLFSQIFSIQPTSYNAYGRGLYSDICSERNTENNNPCNIDGSASTVFLQGASEAYQTLNNLSTTNQIANFELDGHTYSLIIDAKLPKDVDFQASTFALNTECKPISKECGLVGLAGTSTPFNCSSGFAGDATSLEDADRVGYRRAASPVGMILLNPDVQTNISLGSKDLNPFYLGTWAAVDNQNTLSNATSQEILQSDPEIATPVHGGLSWVFLCTVSVYDATYSWINGSISTPTLTSANTSVGGLIAAPLAENFGLSNLEIATRIASFSLTAQDVANKWATLFSQIALGLSAGVMSSRTNLQEQTRTEILVARIPKVPLFTLIGLNLLYATVGLALALYAMCVSRPHAARDAQARLSVAGLAARFEEPNLSQRPVAKVEDLFAEREGKECERIGLVQTQEGGWRYVGF